VLNIPDAPGIARLRSLCGLAVICLFLALVPAPNTAQASDADLDPSFGAVGGGRVLSNLNGTSDIAWAAALQTDGKIVAVGSTNFGVDFAVVRYNTDGSLDSSFGSGGVVVTDFSGGGDSASAVAIQTDGKIVVAGVATGASSDFGLARYDTDGSLDPTFGSGGKVTTDFAGGLDLANAVAIQADGKIVAAGLTQSATTGGDFALARYNSDGTLDTTFGIGGKVTTDFGGPADSASAVAIQADGKIVAAGRTYENSNYDFALVRYNADGSLDPSFGTGGKVTTDFAAGTDFASDLAIQPDGKILAAGWATPAGSFSAFGLVRYNTDGSLDLTFGSGGKVTASPTAYPASVRAVAIESNGKIVAAGQAENSLFSTDFALIRFNADGSVDTTFGGGSLVTDFRGANDAASGLVVRGDGRIVAVGSSDDSAGSSTEFALAGYNIDGSPDLTFGPIAGGRVLTDVGGQDFGQAMALQGDGKIVVVGVTSVSGQSFAVVRYRADGTPDPGFGNGGIVVTALPGGPASASGVAIQTDGKILVAGSVQAGSSGDFALVRYNTDGSLDGSFGTGGIVTTDFAGGYDSAVDVVLQSDGKVLAVGLAQESATGYDFALARYNPDGTLDATFGTGGKVTTDFAGQLDLAGAAVIQSDGKIVAAGRAFTGANTDFALARYNSDGSLDPAFGTGGKVTTDFSGATDFANAVLLQPDGKLVLVGYANGIFGLARYNTDGTLDSGFGTGGKVTTDFSGHGAWAFAAALQPDNKILAGGRASDANLNTDFALARYNSDGSLDPTFGTDGKVTTDFRGINDQIEALAIQNDGKIVAAGASYYGLGIADFAVARYLGTYSQFAVSQVSLDSAPSIGGQAVAVIGTNFQTGASVAIQGVSAPSVLFESPAQLIATVPPGSPGAVGDVVVTNPGGATATLTDGFVYDFLDVPVTNAFHRYVIALARARITGGCGGGNFCPADPVARSQMAVFLLRSEHGSSYFPPPCSTSVFADVPCSNGFAPWINQIYAEGITGGCSSNPLMYCPSNPVTRAQMAVFLLVAEHGPGYTPPPAVGIFQDVPASSPLAPWIEQLYNEGITGGCSNNPLLFCPAHPVLRDQMAVFLTETFLLTP
jgi:uncharacterized delta-60 repeat protein